MSPELAQIAEAQVENPIVDLGTLETFVPQAKTVFRWPTIAALGTLALANINTEVAYAASADATFEGQFEVQVIYAAPCLARSAYGAYNGGHRTFLLSDF